MPGITNMIFLTNLLYSFASQVSEKGNTLEQPLGQDRGKLKIAEFR